MKYVRIVPMTLLVCLITKSLISGPDFAHMGSILGLCLLIAFIEYKENEKVIKDIQNEMKSINTYNELLKKEVSDIKSYMNAARITDGLKNPLRKM